MSQFEHLAGYTATDEHLPRYDAPPPAAQAVCQPGQILPRVLFPSRIPVRREVHRTGGKATQNRQRRLDHPSQRATKARPLASQAFHRREHRLLDLAVEGNQKMVELGGLGRFVGVQQQDGDRKAPEHPVRYAAEPQPTQTTAPVGRHHHESHGMGLDILAQ